MEKGSKGDGKGEGKAEGKAKGKGRAGAEVSLNIGGSSFNWHDDDDAESSEED